MKIIVPLVIAAVLLPVAATAQERTAGQAYDAQVNWASLKGMFDRVDAQNKILAATITKMQACAAKDALYKPGDSAADADGCVGTGGLKLGQKVAVSSACYEKYSGNVPVVLSALFQASNGRLLAAYSGAVHGAGSGCRSTNTPYTTTCTRTYDGKDFSNCSCNRTCRNDDSDNGWGN